MRVFSKHHLAFIALLPALCIQAQYTDTSSFARNAGDSLPLQQKWTTTTSQRTFSYKSFVVPAVLIVYGISSLESHSLKKINKSVREEIWYERPHKTTKIDNYLLYSPAVAVYGLNALGIKGKNNLRDRSMLLLLSNVFVNGTVFGAKRLTRSLRPDGTDRYSFPSGHTAECFASAEFMRQEYKDVSPWYGIAGYVAAGATGALRMYNNRHWLSDVLAGAGVGIASTKLAYWIYPTIKKKLFRDKPVNTMIMPYYQSGGAGLAMVYRFR